MKATKPVGRRDALSLRRRLLRPVAAAATRRAARRLRHICPRLDRARGRRQGQEDRVSGGRKGQRVRQRLVKAITADAAKDGVHSPFSTLSSIAKATLTVPGCDHQEVRRDRHPVRGGCRDDPVCGTGPGCEHPARCDQPADRHVDHHRGADRQGRDLSGAHATRHGREPGHRSGGGSVRQHEPVQRGAAHRGKAIPVQAKAYETALAAARNRIRTSRSPQSMRGPIVRAD